MVDRYAAQLLTGGHILIEGVPGLAKTLAVRTVAQALRLGFHRIQFTPDLLPADVIGTQIYNPRSGEFSIKKGPIFANFVLADEINRAPAKVQSALLEAMQEKQVTRRTELSARAAVSRAGTQNPIEQEGTYPLPEAQIDRFMLKVKITYPSKDEELAILERMALIDPEIKVTPVLSAAEIFQLRKVIDGIYMDAKIKRYIVDIVHATRRPSDYGLDIGPLIQYGASPRATGFPWRAGVRTRAFGRPLLRHAARRQNDRLRRSPPSRQRHLRSRSGRHHGGKAAAAHFRHVESAVGPASRAGRGAALLQATVGRVECEYGDSGAFMESVYLETTFISYLVACPSRDVIVAGAPADHTGLVAESTRRVRVLGLSSRHRRGVSRRSNGSRKKARGHRMHYRLLKY